MRKTSHTLIHTPAEPAARAADGRYVLLGIGLLIGGVLALGWELSVPDEHSSREAAASTRAAARRKAEPIKPLETLPSPAHILARLLASAMPPMDAMPRPQTPARLRPEQLRVERVLVGGELVADGLLSPTIIEREQDRSRYLVYFELAALAEPDRATSLPACDEFRLDDREGAVYEPLCNLTGLRPARPVDGRAPVQLVFAVYNDSAPARLLYRGDTGEFAPLPDQPVR